jgi:hypothetical protein
MKMMKGGKKETERAKFGETSERSDLLQLGQERVIAGWLRDRWPGTFF